MEAIEFTTEIGTNGIIEIPETYKETYRGRVKVIILKEEDASTKEKVAEQYAKLKAIIEAIRD